MARRPNSPIDRRKPPREGNRAVGLDDSLAGVPVDAVDEDPPPSGRSSVDRLSLPNLGKLWRPAWHTVMVLAVGVAIGVALRSWLASRSTAASTERAREIADSAHLRLATGPWGEVSAERVWLMPPEELLEDEACPVTARAWSLAASSRAEAERKLAGSGLEGRLLSAWMSEVRCSGADPCTVHPTLSMREELSRSVRTRLYQGLGQDPSNEGLFFHVRILEGDFDEWLATSGLPNELRDRIRALSWTSGGITNLSDAAVVCAAAKPEERRRIFRALSREPALVARLRIPQGADSQALAAWWTTPERPDVPSLFASLASMPDGGTVDIVALLPPGPRALVYRYPRPADPPRDCYWTALNFHTVTPDDRFLDPKEVGHFLSAQYQEIAQSEARLGDIVALVDDTEPIHVASYLTGNLVLTKNGGMKLRPWSIETLDSVIASYSYTRPAKARYFHRRR